MLSIINNGPKIIYNTDPTQVKSIVNSTISYRREA